MGVEVADVEAPQHGPLDLGPALAAHLVEVGVVPHVGDRPGEPSVAVEEGRGLGDRAPAVEVVLGVEGQADPDVVAPEPRGRLAGPRRRHQQGRRGGEPVAERLVDAGARRVAEAQVGTVEDEEAGIGVSPEPLGHGRHAPTVVGARSGGAAGARPRSRARASAMPRRTDRCRVCSSSRQPRRSRPGVRAPRRRHSRVAVVERRGRPPGPVPGRRRAAGAGAAARGCGRRGSCSWEQCARRV